MATQHIIPRISFLLTGDEIVTGDIIERNAKTMSQVLFSAGACLQKHLACSDQVADIVACLTFLYQDCDCLIVTGGLGPTSDDRTRDAIAAALKLPLVENEQALSWIKQRHQQTGIVTNTGHHRQALFPKESEVIPNHLGSAWGFLITHRQQVTVSLPGPPHENRPMFDLWLMPWLRKHYLLTPQPFCRWLTLGLIEGKIAAEIDDCLADLSIVTGYRWHYPYLEIKIKATDYAVLDEAKKRLEPMLQQHIVSHDHRTASELLQQFDTPGKMLKLACPTIWLGLAKTIVHPRIEWLNVDRQHEADVFFAVDGVEQHAKQIRLEAIMANQSHHLTFISRPNQIHMLLTAYWSWRIHQTLLLL